MNIYECAIVITLIICITIIVVLFIINETKLEQQRVKNRKWSSADNSDLYKSYRCDSTTTTLKFYDKPKDSSNKKDSNVKL